MKSSEYSKTLRYCHHELLNIFLIFWLYLLIFYEKWNSETRKNRWCCLFNCVYWVQFASSDLVSMAYTSACPEHTRMFQSTQLLVGHSHTNVCSSTHAPSVKRGFVSGFAVWRKRKHWKMQPQSTQFWKINWKSLSTVVPQHGGCAESLQSCLALCDPVSPSHSFLVHGIL